jgi:hypothetical protein
MTTSEEMEVYLSTVIHIDDDDLIIALFDQGLDTMESINILKAKDITTICSIIREPGGMMMDEDGDLIPNRGQPVSAMLKKQLKQLWFFVRYAYMTQRLLDFDTREGVPELEDLAKLDVFISNFSLPKYVEKPPQFPGIDKARKRFEQFDQWATSTKTIGSSGAALLYVIREEDEVDNDENPGCYEPNFALRGPHGDGNMFWN